MSITTSFVSRTAPRASWSAVARAAVAQGWTGTKRWVRIVSTRRSLTELDDRMLSDLGISRAQANFEQSRMPWTK